VFVCACACVCEKESEREKEIERNREKGVGGGQRESERGGERSSVQRICVWLGEREGVCDCEYAFVRCVRVCVRLCLCD